MMGRIGIIWLLLAVITLAQITWSEATDNSAVLSAGRAELERAARSMIPRPSLDTTPIEFSINGIKYRIPRNYLTIMEQWNGGPQTSFVTVKINLPDMKPLSQEMEACFDTIPTARPPQCEPLSFSIYGTGGNSADEAFASIRHLFHSQAPLNGPFGYEKYEIGPENARGEYYKKIEENQTRLYRCQIFDNKGTRNGLCQPISDRVKSGTAIHFFFNLNQLEDIEKIDANLRHLVEEFTEK